MMRLIASVLAGVSLVGCGGGGPAPSEKDRVGAVYSPKTGRLSELRVDIAKDGKPDIISYMDGSKFLRIEVDSDENGRVDRWEYYGPNQKLEKVGYSRPDDGKVDSWAYQAADGSVAKLEISTRRDGVVNRTEFYEKNVRIRAEEDTNGDGRVDKWETYNGDALSSVSFDLTNSGKPTKTIEYRNSR